MSADLKSMCKVLGLAEILDKVWREGKLTQFSNRFKSGGLIILDEKVYVPFNKEGAKRLFQLVSDWYKQKNIIITSNLGFSQRNRVFSDSESTVSFVDQVIRHAHILNSTGDSVRVTNASSRKNKRNEGLTSFCIFHCILLHFYFVKNRFYTKCSLYDRRKLKKD